MNEIKRRLRRIQNNEMKLNAETTIFGKMLKMMVEIMMVGHGGSHGYSYGYGNTEVNQEITKGILNFSKEKHINERSPLFGSKINK